MDSAYVYLINDCVILISITSNTLIKGYLKPNVKTYRRMQK